MLTIELSAKSKKNMYIMRSKRMTEIKNPKSVMDVVPSEKTKEWLETVNQIVSTNFRCPNCGLPLTMGVFEILFKDKEEKKDG